MVNAGNHETMNVQGQFRYATSAGLKEFESWRSTVAMAEELKVYPISRVQEHLVGLQTSVPSSGECHHLDSTIEASEELVLHQLIVFTLFIHRFATPWLIAAQERKREALLAPS